MSSPSQKTADRKPIVMPGTKVPIYGTVAAVGCISGERYYWCIDARGDVSMLPAEIIEVELHV